MSPTIALHKGIAGPNMSLDSVFREPGFWEWIRSAARRDRMDSMNVTLQCQTRQILGMGHDCPVQQGGTKPSNGLLAKGPVGRKSRIPCPGSYLPA
jgi:hypothetical protein